MSTEGIYTLFFEGVWGDIKIQKMAIFISVRYPLLPFIRKFQFHTEFPIQNYLYENSLYKTQCENLTLNQIFATLLLEEKID